MDCGVCEGGRRRRRREGRMGSSQREDESQESDFRFKEGSLVLSKFRRKLIFSSKLCYKIKESLMSPLVLPYGKEALELRQTVPHGRLYIYWSYGSCTSWHYHVLKSRSLLHDRLCGLI